MARTITIGQRIFPVGTFSREINTIPVASSGFELRISRNDPNGLATLSGKVADLLVEISPDDGAHYIPWIPTQLDGGEMLDRFGNTITHVIVSGLWPGEADADGKRKELKQTNVRFTITVIQAFRASATLSDI